jgi:hypothetical protein
MPGILGKLDNRIAPANIVMTMTILWYTLFEQWDTGMGSKTTFLGITTMLIFLAQLSSFYISSCSNSYQYGNASPWIALVIGIASSVISYYINKSVPASIYTYKNNPPPLQTTTPGVFVCPPGSVADGKGGCMYSSTPPKETPIIVGEPSKQTEPVDDQDQFVCEAYKDGELVTSTIVE